MTLDFYDLTEEPFGASPNPKFFYSGSSHRQALASLLRAMQAGRGILTLQAQPGLGKTTTLLHALKSFGGKVTSVYLGQPPPKPVDLLRAILKDLGALEIEENSEQLRSQLEERLIEQHRLGQRVIIVLDEARDLDTPVFELLCMLSTLQGSRGGLIQFILCGRPLLTEKLATLKPKQPLTPLAQLEPFSADDTAQYIDHRLRIAGYGRQTPLFTPEAAILVARFSEGSPRNINGLCTAVIATSYRRRREQIGPDIVREVAASLDLARPKQQNAFAVEFPASVPSAPLRPASVPVQVPLEARVATQPRSEQQPRPQGELVHVSPQQFLPLPATTYEKVNPVAAEQPQPVFTKPSVAVAAAQSVVPPQTATVKAGGTPARPALQKSSVAHHRFPSRLSPGLTAAVALLLIATGGVFATLRTGTSSPYKKQTSAAPTLLRPSAPLAGDHEAQLAAHPNPRVASVAGNAETPHSGQTSDREYDLKGMDLKSALRALASKTQSRR